MNVCYNTPVFQPFGFVLARIYNTGVKLTRWVPDYMKVGDRVRYFSGEWERGEIIELFATGGGKHRLAGPCETNTVHPATTVSKESPMLDIQHKTYINGADITLMTDDRLFEIIRQTEIEIESLSQIKRKPKRLQSKIKQLYKGLDTLITLLDSRDTPPAVGTITD